MDSYKAPSGQTITIVNYLNNKWHVICDNEDYTNQWHLEFNTEEEANIEFERWRK